MLHGGFEWEFLLVVGGILAPEKLKMRNFPTFLMLHKMEKQICFLFNVFPGELENFAFEMAILFILTVADLRPSRFAIP